MELVELMLSFSSCAWQASSEPEDLAMNSSIKPSRSLLAATLLASNCMSMGLKPPRYDSQACRLSNADIERSEYGSDSLRSLIVVSSTRGTDSSRGEMPSSRILSSVTCERVASNECSAASVDSEKSAG